MHAYVTELSCSIYIWESTLPHSLSFIQGEMPSMQRMPEAAEPQKHTGCVGLYHTACPIGTLNLVWNLQTAFLHPHLHTSTGVLGGAHLWCNPSWGGLFVSWETGDASSVHCLCLSASLHHPASPTPMFY